MLCLVSNNSSLFLFKFLVLEKKCKLMNQRSKRVLKYLETFSEGALKDNNNILLMVPWCNVRCMSHLTLITFREVLL